MVINRCFVAYAIAFSVSAFVPCAGAVQTNTQVGKVVMVEGHYVSSCRLVKHKETSTGTVRYFRIRNVEEGRDDISAISMAALLANRDVIIFYDSSLPFHCGSEPEVIAIDMY